jgi:hypothetical protein
MAGINALEDALLIIIVDRFERDQNGTIMNG